MANGRAEFRQGWTIVLSSATGFALGLSGLPFYTNSVFVDSLHKQFGWSIASLQTNILVVSLLGLITTPTVGWLTDRIGSRRLAIGSTLLFSVAFMSLSRLNGDYKGFLLTWFCIAVAGAGTLSVVWSRTITTWFSDARGLALGMTLIGTGVTGFVAPPLAAWLIERWGWRIAYIALGAAPLVISVPMLLAFFKEKRESIGPAPAFTGSTALEALSHWRFWLIGICLLCVSITVAGVIPNLVKLLTSHGFPRREAAWVASLVGLCVVVGRLSCGALLDRVWAPLIGFCFFAGLPVACIILSLDHISAPLAMLAAGLVGLGAAAEFDVIPFLVSRYFGLKKFGSVLGLVTLFFCIGSSVGPVAFGRVFDLFGSYRPILLAAGAVSVLGSSLLLLLGSYRGRINDADPEVGEPLNA